MVYSDSLNTRKMINIFPFALFIWSVSYCKPACLPNSIIKGINIIEPKATGIMVAEVFFVKVRIFVDDVPSFMSNSSHFSMCVVMTTSGGSAVERCGLRMFDEHALRGEKGNSFELQAKIFHSEVGYICYTEPIVVSCCLEAVSFNERRREYRQSQIESFLRWSVDARVLPYGHAKDINQAMKLRCFFGIKSAALNIGQRNSIRETWFRALLASENNMQARFLIGKTDASEVTDSLLLERQIYHDTLLGDELPVADSYHTLPQKTTLFLHLLLIAKGIQPDYVIICDDDVYVNIAALTFYLDTAPKKRLYAGEVLGIKMNQSFHPQRDKEHINFVTTKQYPLSELPNFVLGNFIILSLDVATFIATNAYTLRPVGSLEDVTIGLWMLAIQVYPQHLPGICDLISCDLGSVMVATDGSRLMECVEMVGAGSGRPGSIRNMKILNCSTRQIMASSPGRHFLSHFIAISGLRSGSDFDAVDSMYASAFLSLCDCNDWVRDGNVHLGIDFTKTSGISAFLMNLGDSIHSRAQSRFYYRNLTFIPGTNNFVEDTLFDDSWPFPSADEMNRYNHQYMISDRCDRRVVTP